MTHTSTITLHHKHVLIATSKAPNRETWQEFANEIEFIGEHDYGIEIRRQGATDGPGCANIVFECVSVDPARIERFADAITLAMFPARWTYTTDDNIPDGYQLSR